MSITSKIRQNFPIKGLLKTLSALEFFNIIGKLILLFISYNIFFIIIKAIFAFSISTNYGIPFVDIFSDSDINTNSYIIILIFNFIIISSIPTMLYSLIGSKKIYGRSYTKTSLLYGFLAFNIFSINLTLTLNSITGYIFIILISILSLLLIYKEARGRRFLKLKIFIFSVLNKKIRTRSKNSRKRALDYINIALLSSIFYSAFIILIFYVILLGQENIILTTVENRTPRFISKDIHVEIYTFFLIIIPLIMFFTNYLVSIIFFSRNIFFIMKIIASLAISSSINILLVSFLAGNFFYIVNRHLFVLSQGGGAEVQIILSDEIYKIYPSMRSSYKSNISKTIKLLIKTEKYTFFSSCEIDDFIFKVENDNQDKIIIYKRRNKNNISYCSEQSP